MRPAQRLFVHIQQIDQGGKFGQENLLMRGVGLLNDLAERRDTRIHTRQVDDIALVQLGFGGIEEILQRVQRLS